MLKYYSKGILEKFFLYLIDSLNVFANFPELFFLILNTSFKNLLIYICGHSTLEHFKYILNMFFARLSDDPDNSVAIRLPFLLNFIEKIVLDSSFLAKIGSITKNSFKKEINQALVESKQAHLLTWVLSFEIFAKFSQISPLDSFSFFEQIFRELLLSPRNYSFLSKVKKQKRASNELFFENVPALLNHFCHDLYQNDSFHGHLFLLLVSNEFKLTVKAENVKK